MDCRNISVLKWPYKKELSNADATRDPMIG